MSRFNQYFTTHFAGCRLLAKTRDVYRNRDVSVFLIPTEIEYVGVSDGVDCWIAPTAANPFQIDIRKVIGDVVAGVDRPVAVAPRQRIKIDAPEAHQIKERARVRIA